MFTTLDNAFKAIINCRTPVAFGIEKTSRGRVVHIAWQYGGYAKNWSTVLCHPTGVAHHVQCEKGEEVYSHSPWWFPLLKAAETYLKSKT